jgi:uncharacterized Zn finger protein
MSWGYQFRPYVSVAQRRANAAREVAKMSKKGRAVAPVQLAGKTIATTFWGKAWCDNLESYSDYANRLPRGRTYVRNGSVVDLQIAEGQVTALVSGSSLYKIKIQIQPLAGTHWKRVQTECAGKIDSLIEMLQGRLSASVMQVVTQPGQGLFPKPAEIKMNCSCPDWAGLCKHLAAVLYGVGARLDEKPELLFQLRGVDPSELISKASAAEAVRQTTTAAGQPAIADADLADVFGIELDAAPTAKKPATPRAKARFPAPSPPRAKSKASAPAAPRTKPKTTPPKPRARTKARV